MFTVTAEAPVGEIYLELKHTFDRKHVKKRKKVWQTMHPARGIREHTKPEAVPEADGGLSDKDSLRFRLALKSVQQQVSFMDGKAKVKVTIKSDDKSVQTKVEEV